MKLFEEARNATWESGKLGNNEGLISPVKLKWGGSDGDSDGFVRDASNEFCEDGKRHPRTLWTHPKWAGDSSLKGWFPWVAVKKRPYFTTKVGFRRGASGTDGVEFQVWIHRMFNGREVWHRLISHHKTFDSSLDEITVDLSAWANQKISIELRVDTGTSSGKDWAVWVDPRIEERQKGTTAKIWEFSPQRLTVNRTDDPDGTDEPYLGAIYWRCLAGVPGSAKVSVLDTLLTSATGLSAGGSTAIPAGARLDVSDAIVPWGQNDAPQLPEFGAMLGGYEVIAMDEDWFGKDAVRGGMKSTARDILTALRRRIEPVKVDITNLDPIKNAVTALIGDLTSPPSIRGGETIFELLGDDPIGQASFRFLGIDKDFFTLIRSSLPSAVRGMMNPVQPQTLSGTAGRSSGPNYTVTLRMRERDTGRLVN